jgi:hypothetical protein
VVTTRTGLFIIRAWIETGSSSPLRAQIRLTTDVSQGFERTLTVAERDAVVEAIQGWLSDVLPRRNLDPGLAGGRLPRSGAVRISSYFRTL